ncbi:TPA: hypothetical protein RKX70_004162 [Escherichia coli]|nr:hypothetical protein [Escherichia coli]
MKEKLSGQVQRVAHVATVNDSNLMLFGVLFCDESEWIRICTTEIAVAESIAFLSPGALVQLDVGDKVTVHTSQYRAITSVHQL